MTLAIQELRRRRRDSSEELESYLRAHSFPLVEGQAVTFEWSGEAERVHLRHWIYGLPSSQGLRRLEDGHGSGRSGRGPRGSGRGRTGYRWNSGTAHMVASPIGSAP